MIRRTLFESERYYLNYKFKEKEYSDYIDSDYIEFDYIIDSEHQVENDGYRTNAGSNVRIPEDPASEALLRQGSRGGHDRVRDVLPTAQSLSEHPGPTLQGSHE